MPVCLIVEASSEKESKSPHAIPVSMKELFLAQSNSQNSPHFPCRTQSPVNRERLKMQEVPQKKKNCYLYMSIQFKLNTTYFLMHLRATGSFYAKA